MLKDFILAFLIGFIIAKVLKIFFKFIKISVQYSNKVLSWILKIFFKFIKISVQYSKTLSIKYFGSSGEMSIKIGQLLIFVLMFLVVYMLFIMIF